MFSASKVLIFFPTKYLFTTKIVAFHTFIRIKHKLSFKEYNKQRKLSKNYGPVRLSSNKPVQYFEAFSSVMH